MANNKAVRSAKLDLQSSRSALWETISAALPQLEGTGSFTDNLMLMTTLLPGEFFGQPGEKIPVTFGTKYNTGASIQASLLIFNAPLYIGMETAKLAGSLSEQNLEKTELDTRESQPHISDLVSEQSLRISRKQHSNLKKP